METIRTLLTIFTLIFSIIALGVNSFIAYHIFKKGKEIDEKFLLFTEKNKFKLAAIDKRLQVAQEAFNLWEEMRKVVHSDFAVKIKIVNECTDWWHKNCLYLSPSVRKEFFKIIRRIEFYEVNKQIAQDNHNFDDLNKIFNEINDLGEIIEESVDLEPISSSKK